MPQAVHASPAHTAVRRYIALLVRTLLSLNNPDLLQRRKLYANAQRAHEAMLQRVDPPMPPADIEFEQRLFRAVVRVLEEDIRNSVNFTHPDYLPLELLQLAEKLDQSRQIKLKRIERIRTRAATHMEEQAARDKELARAHRVKRHQAQLTTAQRAPARDETRFESHSEMLALLVARQDYVGAVLACLAMAGMDNAAARRSAFARLQRLVPAQPEAAEGGPPAELQQLVLRNLIREVESQIKAGANLLDPGSDISALRQSVEGTVSLFMARQQAVAAQAATPEPGQSREDVLAQRAALLAQKEAARQDRLRAQEARLRAHEARIRAGEERTRSAMEAQQRAKEARLLAQEARIRASEERTRSAKAEQQRAKEEAHQKRQAAIDERERIAEEKRRIKEEAQIAREEAQLAREEAQLARERAQLAREEARLAREKARGEKALARIPRPRAPRKTAPRSQPPGTVSSVQPFEGIDPSTLQQQRAVERLAAAITFLDATARREGPVMEFILRLRAGFIFLFQNLTAESRFAFAWTLLAPAVLLGLISSIYWLRDTAFIMNMDVATFSLLGAGTWVMTRQVIFRVSTGLAHQRYLLNAPRMGTLNIAMANALIYTLIFLISLLSLGYFGYQFNIFTLPHAPGLVFLYFLSFTLVGFMIGIIFGCIAVYWPFFLRLAPPIERFIQMFSSVFIVTEQLPEQFKPYALWCPTAHGMQIMKAHYFVNYTAADANFAYYWGSVFILSFVALAMLRFTRVDIQPN